MMKADKSTMLGWILSGLFAAFLLLASATPKLAMMPIAEETLASLGWPAGHAFAIGLVELVLVLLYLYRPTALLGAVLLMALLGGAMASHLRASSPLFSHTFFSIYLGVVMWAGLWLRDADVRRLFPLKTGQPRT